MEGIKIDLETYRKMGMTILSNADVAPMRAEMKEVLAKTKVCEQCHRRLPLSCFNATDEAMRENSDIERYCSLCWSCP
jgi:hypothetical protein